MPTGNLPAEGKKIWERVHSEAKTSSTCKDSPDVEACAAKVAWTAVHNAGWKKDADGNWTKSKSFTEFSLRIERAVYDKATNERRWKAVASDTDEDSREDNMSLELFNDFISRIQTQEPVPEEFRSEFWQGGMPYLSVSHYPDLNGDGVPGVVDAVYIDGSYLKAKGRFNDNPLGRKSFESICADLYGSQSNGNDKVRISIAFLDWAHKHKSNGFIFERDEEDDICPECFRELLSRKSQGKVFLSGHLVHLAMTRVPVNKRTDMEVDKSMADIKTRKDDAASIVGDDLAEELENKAKLVGKSEALVIKSEDEVDQVQEEKADVMPKDVKKCPKCGQEMPANGTKCPACKAELDDMQEEEGCGDKKKKKSEVQEGGNFTQEMFESLVSAMKSAISEEIQIVIKTPEPIPHPLDVAFASFKSAFDNLSSINGEAEKLHMIQEPFNILGQMVVEQIKSTVKPVEQEVVVNSVPASGDLAATIARAISDAMNPIAQKLDLVSTQLQSSAGDRVPLRRSIDPKLVHQLQDAQPVVKSQTPKLREVIERTTR